MTLLDEEFCVDPHPPIIVGEVKSNLLEYFITCFSCLLDLNISSFEIVDKKISYQGKQKDTKPSIDNYITC